ncbi:hypothetical protein ACIBQ1_33125 [Nonomuraea sp. NPDC050153]|uniref:hypothetical protein n=1 Tax=Nonomuraea sp. NPDC050153 TaxID=3364359 RepID=UPI0037B1D068
MKPGEAVIGGAPSERLHHHDGYNTITQNSCGDILFETEVNKLHACVGDNAYSVNSPDGEGRDHSDGLCCIGSSRVSQALTALL